MPSSPDALPTRAPILVAAVDRGAELVEEQDVARTAVEQLGTS